MANRLPMMVVARLIGLPDDDVDQLIRWAYATTTLLDGIVAADQPRLPDSPLCNWVATSRSTSKKQRRRRLTIFSATSQDVAPLAI